MVVSFVFFEDVPEDALVFEMMLFDDGALFFFSMIKINNSVINVCF